uniref:Uncharacterized protein n=1 Tax=Macrostomum lignano TaxID=282301 RepID=A0A1I8JBK3_9PLAT
MPRLSGGPACRWKCRRASGAGEFPVRTFWPPTRIRETTAG